ncbi:hypothetical protein BAUCODRAFT_219166 [Baudoinia panamericana UAMH 10762]|uniref:Uncharacterized protein n=1 Tax=Baudoinia panamericana (strain UAMH 10762) TaxID=717646 RepID=M2MC20_BAUPA|nr:uncharacterized protein BAUCODRAFT_219166 [Baudoinia panamericana UAMH 10762]EMC94031.1 hypothetical protein BAUCODRAFT_219166 [Baudoinia panamericana UAMH 10762]
MCLELMASVRSDLGECLRSLGQGIRDHWFPSPVSWMKTVRSAVSISQPAKDKPSARMNLGYESGFGHAEAA